MDESSLSIGRAEKRMKQTRITIIAYCFKSIRLSCIMVRNVVH